jgi:hypothetical protein
MPELLQQGYIGRGGYFNAHSRNHSQIPSLFSPFAVVRPAELKIVQQQLNSKREKREGI